MMMLEVADLSVAYGAVEAITNVSFQVEEGQLVSLLGSNGAGKTTVLRAISGLVRIRTGTIRFVGLDLHGLAPDRRVARGIAHVPEGRRVFAGMSVWENLVLGGYLCNRREVLEADLNTVFALFPILEERRSQIAGTLSGGEQQMLAIGRALMSRPRLLIMDEPTMGLAPKMVELILDKVSEIRASGTTVLMVEQSAIETVQISDRIYVLRLGRVAFEGTGDQLSKEMLRTLYLGREM